ncbi:hypothetical protein Hanom_Chr08g00729601 [Helianthus anomalus]
MFSDVLVDSPAIARTVKVVQKLPYNHKKTIPETTSNKRPRVNPTKSATKTTMACKDKASQLSQESEEVFMC